MLILEANKVKKYYADRLIIEIENVKGYSEDKIGIVGINGAGQRIILIYIPVRQLNY